MNSNLIGLWHCEAWDDFSKFSYVHFSDDGVFLQLYFVESSGQNLNLFVDVISASMPDSHEMLCERSGGGKFSLLARQLSDDTLFLYREDIFPAPKCWIAYRVSAGAIPEHLHRLMLSHPRIPSHLKCPIDGDWVRDFASFS